MSLPPTVILPCWTSQKRAINLEIVLLPEPEGPTRAVTLPWGILQETSLITDSWL